MKTTARITSLILGLFLALPSVGVQASTIAYTPQNPAIFSNANPANSSILMATVPQPKNPTPAASSDTISPSSVVEQAVLSQASTAINNKIFNSTPGQSGSFQLGDGSTISYANVLGVISLTVTDSHGTTVIGGF